MGLFRRKNKTPTPFNRLKDECKKQDIPLAYFYGWHHHIGEPQLTDELVTEFLNRPHPLYKTELRVELVLPEMTTEIHGGMMNGSGFTRSVTDNTRVKCRFFFAEKGIVFKEAINKSEDLRLPWDTITDCSIRKNYVDVFCDAVNYSVKLKSDTALLFKDFVDSHMSGRVDDGWS